MVYVTKKKLIYLIFVGFVKTLPGFHQHLPENGSVFPLLFCARHFQYLEIVLTNIG
jgi:hypothetical protein